MAGLFLEQIFNAPSFVDVSVALDDPAVYQDVQQMASPQPDYLMWGEPPQSPYYVVECKGCQTNSSTSIDQIRRGLEQVPSLVFGMGARTVVTLVVATYLAQDRTTVFVLDPPNDNSSDSHSESEKVSERTGKRSWRITNVKEFELRARLSRESELLKWAGQFSQALERDRLLTHREAVPSLPNFELEVRKTNIAAYRGYSFSLFPELDRPALKVFTGVEDELLARITEASPELHRAAAAIQNRVSEHAIDRASPYESLSRDGTCMIVEGVD